MTADATGAPVRFARPRPWLAAILSLVAAGRTRPRLYVAVIKWDVVSSCFFRSFLISNPGYRSSACQKPKFSQEMIQWVLAELTGEC